MFLWSFLKWLGRVSLWVLIFPLGLWRSIRHGRRKSEARIIAAMREVPVAKPDLDDYDGFAR